MGLLIGTLMREITHHQPTPAKVALKGLQFPLRIPNLNSMKLVNPLCLFLFLLSLVWTASARGQDADAFNPLGREVPLEEMEKQLRIQVEWIEVSHEQYTALLAETDSTRPVTYKPSNDGPLREDLSALMKKGEAKLLDTMMVVARSGQRAKVESIHEYIYPTEYDPPFLVTSPPPKDGPPAKPKEYGNRLPIPAAFETRHVGSTFEVDPVLGADGITIDLNMSPEIVYLADHSMWGTYKSKEGELDIQMPTFYTMKVTTQVTLLAGEYFLFGACSPLNLESGMPDYGRKVMVMVKADIVVTGLPLEEPKKTSAKKKE